VESTLSPELLHSFGPTERLAPREKERKEKGRKTLLPAVRLNLPRKRSGNEGVHDSVSVEKRKKKGRERERFQRNGLGSRPTFSSTSLCGKKERGGKKGRRGKEGVHRLRGSVIRAIPEPRKKRGKDGKRRGGATKGKWG